MPSARVPWRSCSEELVSTAMPRCSSGNHQRSERNPNPPPPWTEQVRARTDPPACPRHAQRIARRSAGVRRRHGAHHPHQRRIEHGATVDDAVAELELRNFARSVAELHSPPAAVIERSTGGGAIPRDHAPGRWRHALWCGRRCCGSCREDRAGSPASAPGTACPRPARGCAPPGRSRGSSRHTRCPRGSAARSSRCCGRARRTPGVSVVVVAHGRLVGQPRRVAEQHAQRDLALRVLLEGAVDPEVREVRRDRRVEVESPCLHGLHHGCRGEDLRHRLDAEEGVDVDRCAVVVGGVVRSSPPRPHPARRPPPAPVPGRARAPSAPGCAPGNG